jgi:hypothetical protein
MPIAPQRWLTLLAWALIATGCQRAETQTLNVPPVDEAAFTAYWYQGLAELNHYEVQQARYGELRRADAMLIFVTEDFLKDRQVKREYYDESSRTRSLSVLKLNSSLQFLTGIYPYSVLTSVFTPVDFRNHPRSLKLTNTVQEWCGHTYTQFNLNESRYRVASHSYFEKEGDEAYELEGVWLEDELWTRVRIAPASMPVGEIRVIPGLQQARFLHRRPAVETAQASIRVFEDKGDTLVNYTLDYRSYQRELVITFRKAFPHDIVAFESTYLDGFGDRAKRLTTRGIRTQSVRLDYWTKNAVADSTSRKTLGL